jgi:hypothetical protein
MHHDSKVGSGTFKRPAPDRTAPLIVGALAVAVCCGGPALVVALTAIGLGSLVTAPQLPVLGLAAVILAGLVAVAFSWRRRTAASRVSEHPVKPTDAR